MMLELQARSDGSRYGGESWLWQRGGFRAVIDIGAKLEFAHRAASFSPNVVVLTHDDADHVGADGHAYSFINELPKVPDEALPPPFVRSGEPRSVEVWMPMDWLHLGRAALQVMGIEVDGISPPLQRAVPSLRYEQDSEAVLRFFEPGAEGLGLNKGSDVRTHRETDLDISADLEAAVAGAWPLPKSMEHLADIEKAGIAAEVKDVVSEYRQGASRTELPGSDKMVADRAEKSAVRVGHILAALAKRQLLVRFFDVDRANVQKLPVWPWQGIRGTITIINAVAVGTTPEVQFSHPRAALLLASRLTVQNRRALATFLWPDIAWRHVYSLGHSHRGDGVLIWSDTQGQICGHSPTADFVPWRHLGLMSAPHHASKDPAHRLIWAHRPPGVNVILSDNHEEDAIEWLSIPQSSRDCAACALDRCGRVLASSIPEGQGVALSTGCSSFDHRIKRR